MYFLKIVIIKLHHMKAFLNGVHLINGHVGFFHIKCHKHHVELKKVLLGSFNLNGHTLCFHQL